MLLLHRLTAELGAASPVLKGFAATKNTAVDQQDAYSSQAPAANGGGGGGVLATPAPNKFL
jgi:hypothetical protein